MREESEVLSIAILLGLDCSIPGKVCKHGHGNMAKNIKNSAEVPLFEKSWKPHFQWKIIFDELYKYIIYILRV